MFLKLVVYTRATYSSIRKIAEKRFYSGELGGGAGKGGGGGGSIRSSGGAFGRREAALEERYFSRLKEKQMEDLRKLLEKRKQQELQSKETNDEIEKENSHDK